MNWQERKITAKVERVLWPKDAPPGEVANVPTFYIIKTNAGVAKGKLHNFPKENEVFTFEGKWEVSRFNGGMEFVFFRASAYIPADERSLLRYACEMTKGVGVQLENRIWEAKGEAWRTVSSADRIRGLTPTVLAALHETIDGINLQRERATAIAWLMSLGCTVKIAEAAYGKWGSKTVLRVKEDCYALASLPNFSFKDVDSRVRDAFGIGKDDPRRIRAAISYYVAQLTASSTVCSWADLYGCVAKAIDAAPDRISGTCADMFKSGALIPFRESGMIADAREYACEKAVLDYARSSVSLEGVKASQSRTGVKFDADQLAAIQFALDNSFSIINGGAGCGKTTMIRAIADALKKHGRSVELCAFAGKAAARLKEATGHDAATIHRMLDYRGEFGFTRRSLRGVSVILDEASMVASDLMAEIVKRNPDRLVLVGDEAQLPPVGAGQPFHDLIAIAPGSVRTLTTCYRNKEAIFQSALMIRRGVAPPLGAKSDGELWDVCDIRDIRKTHARVLDLVKGGGVDFDHDVILCCRNGEDESDPCSVAALNADIKAIVNPAGDPSASARAITPGDRVINTKNHPELDVWNGTTGRCDRFDSDGGMWVELDYRNAAKEDFVLIPRKNAREWQLAYALTVHKAQGSQYRNVFFVCTKRDNAALLDRPMLYTAVTRAKRECRVVGDVGAFYAAVNSVERKSTIMQELAK